MPHYYTTYGLSIISDLECPELVVSEQSEQADVTVSLADIPPRIDSPFHVTRHAQIGEGVFQFEPVSGFARYRVIGGHTILVQPLSGASPEDVRLYLLGTAFGALLHQQGRLPLHASAIELEGEAVVFCGASGAGKSTLAAALHRRGYPVLCDDVGVVVPNAEGTPVMYPGFPRIKLWRDALEHFEVAPGTLTRDWARSEKFHLQLHEVFHHRPLALREVCFLERAAPTETASLHSLDGKLGVPRLVANTYRPRLVRRLGDPTAHFHRCARIAGSTALRRYVRPWSLDRLDESLDVLLDHLQAGLE